jgi:outer membrane protein OmpA-like peptidoglycan-associated protein
MSVGHLVSGLLLATTSLVVPVDVAPTSLVPADARLAASVTVFSVEGSVRVLARITTAGPTRTLRLGTDVLFPSGSAHLAAAAGRALGQRLQQIPRGVRVTIVGHTDAVGSEASNMGLSVRRARAVAAVMRRARPDLRTTVRGRGEWVPVAPNTDATGRARNRRVDVSWAR